MAVSKKAEKKRFNQAMQEINNARYKRGTFVCCGSSLRSEVAEKIARKGYNVTIVTRNNGDNSYNWVERTKNGKRGEVCFIDETKCETPSTDINDLLEAINQYSNKQ